MSGMGEHQELSDADLAQSFGGWADEYERYRPTYPREAVGWVLHGLTGHAEGDSSESGSLRVGDIGAGTGLMSRVIAGLGHEVVMVEPDDAMREQALDSIGRDLAEGVYGTAEEIPLPDHSLDAVIAAQMWHWVDHAKAARECGRVLRPGGVLGLVWNLLDREQPWWADVEPLTGSGRMQVAEGPEELGEPFGPLESTTFTTVQHLTVEEFVALVNTWSYVRLRDDRDDVLANVRNVLTDDHGFGPDHRIPVRYLVRCYRAVRA
jgi:SAM-dependent methyltransferase